MLDLILEKYGMQDSDIINLGGENYFLSYPSQGDDENSIYQSLDGEIIIVWDLGFITWD